MNFGSLLGAVSRVLPGYMEGERQAVRDNWQDLTNYNQVQQGQLGNLFLEGTMPQRFQMFNDATASGGLRRMSDMLSLLNQWYAAPGQMAHGAAYSMYGPQLAWYDVQNALRAQQMMANNPGAFMPGSGANGARATTPYGMVR